MYIVQGAERAAEPSLTTNGCVALGQTGAWVRQEQRAPSPPYIPWCHGGKRHQLFTTWCSFSVGKGLVHGGLTPRKRPAETPPSAPFFFVPVVTLVERGRGTPGSAQHLSSVRHATRHARTLAETCIAPLP